MRLAPSLLALPILTFQLSAAGPFQWKKGANDRFELIENGKAVLTYNAGVESRPEAPADRARCCYIFPLLSPGGVSPLDDFPADHWHHRGLFWAWPYVSTGGKVYDNWMRMNGIRSVTGAEPKVLAAAAAARLEVTNFWEVAGKRVVSEKVGVTVYPSKGDSRTLDLELTFEALDEPVTLRGSQERGKSYGGLNVRFAPREKTIITSSEGPVDKDTDLVTHAWAELDAIYKGRRAAIRFEADARNPHSPPQWCLRHYGFIGAAFPGRSDTVSEFTLEKGKPLVLRYKVTIRDVR